MKTKYVQAATAAFMAALFTACAATARADDNIPANDKNVSGTIMSLDAGQKALTIRGVLFSKTFVLGDNCSMTLDDRTAMSLADFRPGQKVIVSYKDADGVLVADRLTQDRLFFSGEVTAVDPQNHQVTIRRHGSSKSFVIGDNCRVRLADKDNGTMQDIMPGSRVTVTYETPNGRWIARQIDEPSLRFTGAIGAINLADHTISASKPLLGEKKFHLADNCAVVINGKLTDRPQDLRPGENCELSYQVVDGVNIVNRIAPVMAAEKNTTASQTASSQTPVVPRY
jgi:Cu/Ag efflux protein CusF